MTRNPAATIHAAARCPHCGEARRALSRERRVVLAAIDTMGRINARGVARRTGKSTAAAAQQLAKMALAGLVRRVAPGWYALPIVARVETMRRRAA